MSFPLVQRLRRGAQGDDAELRERLRLEGPADDAQLTAALVGALARDELVARSEWSGDAASTSSGTYATPSLSPTPSVPPPAPTPVELPSDLRSLLAVQRSGAVLDRRRATRQIAAMLRGESDAEPSGEELVSIADALDGSRDLEIAYELVLARRALPGAAGIEVRADDARASALFGELEAAARAYWEGERSEEPLGALAAEDLAILAPRLREASDVLVAHLGALIEGSDGSIDVPGRRALIGAFRYSGDTRLVGSLALVLAARDRVLTTGAARALARIEDPRVRPLLLRAYRASVRPAERAVIAGALGLQGDSVGRAWVRAILSNADPATLRAALEAMATLGQPEDAERLSLFLDHDDVVITSRAVRALGRSGDARALLLLAKARPAARTDGALRVELEDAEAAIVARLELRGEDVPERSEVLAATALTTGARSPNEEREHAPLPSWWLRLRAWLDWVTARLWIALGMRGRALHRLERAAARRPGWAPPLVTLGASFDAAQSAQALAALRRALEADRGWVERHAARLLAQVFLRRAEETARDGRGDIARGLLEEALRLDLRRAPGSLRFEMQRRLGALRGDGG